MNKLIFDKRKKRYTCVHTKVGKYCFLIMLLFGLMTLEPTRSYGQWSNGMNASYLIGQPDFVTKKPGTTSNTLSSANGIAIDNAHGKMYVLDADNNRVLRFSYPIKSNYPSAEIVIGQPDFTSRGSGCSVNQIQNPACIVLDPSGNLWLGDMGNNRMLRFPNIWQVESNQPNADIVIGQTDFSSSVYGTDLANLKSPQMPQFDSNGNLYVSDYENNRVLRFNSNNLKTGARANAFFGGMTSPESSNSMNHPLGITFIGTSMYVSDSWNDRVLRFDNIDQKASGASADCVLGQSDFSSDDIRISPSSLFYPGELTSDAHGNLFVDDGAHARVLVFKNANSLANGANADYVIGQPNFYSATQACSINQLYQTFGLGFDKVNDILFVADGGNSRVLIFGGTNQNFPPLQQATHVQFTSVTDNSCQINWTNGNGAKRLVFVKEGTGTLSGVTDSNTYTASSDLSVPGSQAGSSGFYCVYNGDGSTVSLSNLKPGTNYTVQVCEYSGAPGAELYLTTNAAGNPMSFTTETPLIPLIQATHLQFVNIALTAMNISWTNGSGANRVVFMKEGTGALDGPDPLHTFIANTDFQAKGTQIRQTGYYCIYNGSGSSVSVNNLKQNTVYTVQVFEYNGTVGAEEYLTVTADGNPETHSIDKIDQTILFNPIAVKTVGDADFMLSATGGASGNPIVFTSSDPSIASCDGATVTIKKAGVCTIFANQAGNDQYNAAAQVARVLTVNKPSQTIMFSSLPVKTYGDGSLGLSATGGASGNPVVFTSSDNSIAECTGPNGSVLIIKKPGNCTITANQAGDDSYAAAPSVSQSFTVKKASQTITFNSLDSKSFGDDPFTVSATGGASGNPVYFTSSDPSIATCTGANGSVVTILKGGKCMIYPHQDGNDYYEAASSVGQTLNIDKALQYIVFDPLNDHTYGDAPFQIAATAGASGNPVTFTSSDPSIVSCTGPNGSIITILKAGDCIIYADQAGNDSYYDAAQEGQSLHINKENQSIIFDPLATKIYGDAPFPVSAIGGASNNPVVFSSSDPSIATCIGSTIKILKVGTCTIFAKQNGNANYNPAQASQTLTVNKAPQSILFPAITGKIFGNPPFTISATGGASGNPVIFTSSDPSVATCSGTNGSTITILKAGSCTIYANQAGNSKYEDAPQVAQTLNFGKNAQTIIFNPLPIKTYGDAPFMISATGGASGNPVVFTSSDPSIATCTLVEGVNIVTIIKVGTCSIFANQEGNASYDPAPQVAQVLKVNQPGQIITFNAIPIKTYEDAPFQLSATGGASGNPVVFSSSDPSVATCSGADGSTVTILKAGVCTITARQAGNDLYSAAVPVQRTLTVYKANQNIVFDPIPAKVFGDDPFTVTATGGGSGKPIVFTSSDESIAKCIGSTIIILKPGTCFIYANQTYSDSYNAAPQAMQTLVVSPFRVPGPVCMGEYAMFSLTMDGDHTYQWQENRGSTWADLQEGDVYKDVASSKLSIATGPDIKTNWKYRCLVDGQPKGMEGSVKYKAQTKITDVPFQMLAVVESNKGKTLTFSVSGVGEGKLSSSWTKNGVKITSGAQLTISDQTETLNQITTSLTISNITAADAANYVCEIKGECGSAESNPIRVITYSQPASAEICPGSDADIAVSVSNEQGSLNFQWEQFDAHTLNWIKLDDNVEVSGTQTKNLHLSRSNTDITQVRCLMTMQDDMLRIVSDAAMLTHVKISQNPNFYAFDAVQGKDAKFSVTSNGSRIKYSWMTTSNELFADGAYKSGSITSIEGAKTSSMTIHQVGSSLCGLNLYSQLACDIGSVTSTIGGIGPCTTSSKWVLCVNKDVKLNSEYQGSSYKWEYKPDGGQWTNVPENAIFSNTSSAILSISQTPLSLDGYWLRDVVDGVVKEENKIRVQNTITIPQQPLASQVKMADETLTITVGEIIGAQYEWRKDGVLITDGLQTTGSTVSGAKTNAMKIVHLKDEDEAVYTCRVFNACYDAISSDSKLFIVPHSSSPVDVAICPGGQASFSVQVVADRAVHYQWQQSYDDGNTWENLVDNASISGSHSMKLSITTDVNFTESKLRCVLANENATGVSASAVLKPKKTSEIIQQPASSDKNIGETALFQVKADGEGTLSYQWLKDGKKIDGASQASYSMSNLALSDAGIYTVQARGECGIATSSDARLGVHVPASIVHQASNTSVCKGERAVFTVEGGGEGLLSYQWEIGGSENWLALTESTDYANVASSVLSVSSTDLASNQKFRCRVGNEFGTVYSDAVHFIFKAETQITSHPAAAIKTTGDAYVFTTSAVGEGALSYQWKKDGQLIDGARLSSLSIHSLSKADAGKYRVTISATCGSVDSKEAQLTVGDPPIFNLQPANHAVCPGERVLFVSQTFGDDPIFYQWQVAAGDNWTVLTDSELYSGSMTNSLEINAIDGMDNLKFRCSAVSPYGTAISQAAILTLNNIKITEQPQPISSRQAESIAFSVSASGIAPIAYQWRKNGVDIPNANQAHFSIPNLHKNDEGDYDCVLSNACGTKNSIKAKLSVGRIPMISQQPQAASVCNGSPAQMRVLADLEAKQDVALAANEVLSYQWQQKGRNAAFFENITDNNIYAGSNTNQLSIQSNPDLDASQFRCLIANSFATVQSDVAGLKVGVPAHILVQPVAATVCSGSVYSFVADATGAEPLAFQWQSNPNGTWSDIHINAQYSGSNSKVLSIKTKDELDGLKYRCLVTDKLCQAKTDEALLRVNKLVSVVTPLRDAEKREGESVDFQVDAIGSDLKFQWYKGSVSSPQEQVINGANTSKLSLNQLKRTDEAYYSVLIIGSCGMQLRSASLDMLLPPEIVLQPQNARVCLGDRAIFSVSTQEHHLSNSYQWQRSDDNGLTWIALPDQATTSGSTSVLSVLVSDASLHQYRCSISNAVGTSLSEAVVANIKAPLTIVQQAQDQVQKSHGTAVFGIKLDGENLTYQWYKGGVALVNTARLTGTNSNQLNIADVVAADEGAYSCQIYGECSSTISTAAMLKVGRLSQSITFNVLGEYPMNSPDVELRATASSGLPITYTSDNSSVAQIIENKIHFVGIGSANITASQAGDDRYDPAISVSQVLMVKLGMPEVVTKFANTINTGAALVAGSVLSDGGASITERGICWGTQSNLSISDGKLEEGKGMGQFTKQLLGLKPNTLYYVKAYAINSLGLSYGNELSFTTDAEEATIQASQLQFSKLDITSFDLSWTRGNGTQCAVFIKETSLGTPNPQDFEQYLAKPEFGEGSQIGNSSWFCVYRGTGTSVTVTGLTQGKTYTVMVCEFNGQPGQERYLSVKAEGNPASATTTKRSPLVYTFFTPNGDGRNDVWQIDNADLLANCEIIVYTHSNQEVFHSQGYPVAWDGKYLGNDLPMGEYYFVVKGDYNIKGVLVMMRQ